MAKKYQRMGIAKKSVVQYNDLLSLAHSHAISVLLDNVFINYTVIDCEGNYIAQNNCMKETISKGLVKAQDIDAPSWEHCKEVMKNGKRVIIEEPYKNKTFLPIKQPLYQENKCLGIVILSFDITDRKHAEELHIKNETAKRVIDFTNKIAGSIAHELRTPLSTINLEIDLLGMALSSNKSQQEKDNAFRRTFKVIKKTIQEYVHTISDMLIKVRSFASGQITSTLKETPITTNVDDFLSSYPFAEDEKRLVKLKNFENLENRFQYLGDPILTKHIFSNLVKNSLHAIKDAGKGDITFELRAGSAGDKFNYLIFKDTASGIPQEFVEKIFDQFETKKESSGGTGLGLSFCKMVMGTYNGDITCKSKEGEYTEFVLSFPKL